MLSKAQNKYIRSLSHQKYRKEYQAFTVEGDKIAREWLESSHPVKTIVAIDSWLSDNKQLLQNKPTAEVIDVEPHVLASISTLKTANEVILVAPMPKDEALDLSSGWYIALEGIRDPGNMGTIIRIADWFGVKGVICSSDCVDIYNSKVIQSAMGSHLRVPIVVRDLKNVLAETNMPVLAAVLDGEDIYKRPKQDSGVILIGNESKGLSQDLLSIAKDHITIPRIGGAESLNAGVSTGILCALLIGR